MKKNKKSNQKIRFLVGISLITIGIIISVEQYISWGSFFEIKDIHHEMFIIAFLMTGSIIILLNYLLRRKKKK